MKLYWTHQHGAIIALGACLIIGMVLGTAFSVLQSAAVAFGISAFHAAELALERRKKRAGLVRFKFISWIVYLFILLLSASFLVFGSLLFRILALPLLAAALFLVWMDIAGRKKEITAELITFAMITAVGLLTFNPESAPDRAWVTAWAVLSLYFGLSVFLVKARSGKASAWQGLTYLVFAMTVCFALVPPPMVFLLAGLLLLRSIPFIVLPSLGSRWQIKALGLTEAGYVILLIMTFVIVGRTGPF